MANAASFVDIGLVLKHGGKPFEEIRLIVRHSVEFRGRVTGFGQS